MVTAIREQETSVALPEISIVQIPLNEDFEDRGMEFLAAPSLVKIAARLVDECDELSHLDMSQIDFLWKQKGGKKQNKANMGFCAKTSGLAKFYAGRPWVIWLAADHCREWGFTNYQIEAMTYHELCHAGQSDPDDDGVTEPKVFAHDLEIFESELERYGAWRDDLVRAKHAFDQVTLPGFES